MPGLDGNPLPAAPGTYALLVPLTVPQALPVGRLGTVMFVPGAYVYVGSALGPGGLRGRVGRHLRRVGKKAHWHIDALTAAAPVTAVWITVAPDRLECAWAAALAALPGAVLPVPGFGASDCACKSHLVRVADPAAVGPALQAVTSVRVQHLPGVG